MNDLDPTDVPTGVDWVNPPSLKDLKQNISDAEIDNAAYQENVERWLDNLYITGDAAVTKVTGRSAVVPKVIRKQAEWRYASLSVPFLSSPDLFKVYPKSAGDRKRAQQNALVVNHQFNTYIDKVQFIDMLVRDLVDIGTAMVEVSWVFEEKEVTEEVPVYEYIPQAFDENLAKQYMQLAQLREANRDLYEEHMNPGLEQAIAQFIQTGQLVIPQQVGVESVTKMKETKNYPKVELCEITNMVIDPTCNGDFSRAQFICKKFKSSLSELRKDGRYINLDQIVENVADPLTDPDYVGNEDNQSFVFSDKARKQVVVYTYWGLWDIHDTGIAEPVVISWVDDIIIRMEENPFPFKTPPFAKIVYMPKRRSLYGEPDGELLEENQKIIGAVTRGMIDLMGRSANSQQGFRQGFFDMTNMRKFKRGEDYEFNGQGDPRLSVFQHKYPEIPQSAYNMITMQNADAESLSGVKAFSSGINSRALGDSVGGGRDVLDAASKRESCIVGRMTAGLKEVGRMIISMNSEWLSEEEVIRITNDQFITVRRDDLSGSFDLDLQVSTPEENAKRAEGLEYLLQTTGNNMDPTLRNMILADIARLRKMPDLAKRIEEFKPEPDPMVVKKMELELALLERQIKKEEALIMKHQAEAGATQGRGVKDVAQANLNVAKVTTEQAKSRSLHSDSDVKDLSYLEQHAGIPHKQAMEREQQKIIGDLVKK